MSAGSGISVNMNEPLPPALLTNSPLPAAAPALKPRSAAITAGITCMILTVVSCFVPSFGYLFAGIFGAVALIMIIVGMAQGDQRGLPLLITHIIGTPLACLFASIVSCGAMVGTMGAGAGTVAAITKPTPLPVNRYQTPPASTPELAVAAASTPEPTVAAASTPQPTVAAASVPAFEMIRSTSMISVLTSNRWSGDSLFVSGTLKNTNAVPVRIEHLNAAGFDKNLKRVIEGSQYTIVHNDLAVGETVNFEVVLKDGPKLIRFVEVRPEVAKQ